MQFVFQHLEIGHRKSLSEGNEKRAFLHTYSDSREFVHEFIIIACGICEDNITICIKISRDKKDKKKQRTRCQGHKCIYIHKSIGLPKKWKGKKREEKEEEEEEEEEDRERKRERD
jgi:hypothetical protein